MPAGPGHSRSVLYKRDYLVPRKARPLFGPNEHWVPAYARWEAGSHSIQFLLSMVHCARLCTIAIPNVARSILIHAVRPEETREGSRTPRGYSDETIESRWDAPSVLSTVALHFFSALVLCPEEKKMKLLCSAACRFAAELLCALNAFCRFLSTLFSLRMEAISPQTKSEEPSRAGENRSCNILHDLILCKQCRIINYIYIHI